jgi:hypothetical protein
MIKNVYESVCGGMCALVGVTGDDFLQGGQSFGVIWVFILLFCLTRDTENNMLQGISSVTLLSIRD